jgi:drug/metabolite transporter (DMT)-like permease
MPASGAAPPYRPIDLRGATVALLASLFWGVNPVAIKAGLEDAPPFRLAELRFLVGGTVILVWAATTGRLRGFRIARDEWRPLGGLGLLLAVQMGTMNVATAMTTAAHAAVILNLYAVHTVVLAHFLIPGDRLTLRRLAGVVVAYAGIVVLFGRGFALRGPTMVGDAIMFGSALILAERTVYLARAVQHQDPVKLLLAQAVVGIAVFLVLSAIFEPAATRWTGRLAGVIAFQGVVVTGFNFIVNLWLLKRYRPSALSAFFLTQPIFGVVAAAIFWGEPLTVEVLIAMIAVIVGIALTNR